MVTTTTATSVATDSAIPMRIRTPAIRSDRPTAAAALDRNPASVIAIWIVDRKELESSKSFCTAAAFLFPSCARTLILFLLTETTAISAAAKKALIKIKTNNSINWTANGDPGSEPDILYCSFRFRNIKFSETGRSILIWRICCG